MSKAGEIAKTAFDLLTPDSQTERLTFRRFKGDALSRAAENGTDISNDDVETIILKVNPQEIAYTEPKIIQKVQTNAPGRFVIFDWGTDLISMAISGSTGNLLPGIVQSGTNPLSDVVTDIALKIKPDANIGNAVGGGVTSYAQNLLLGSLTYHELLEMSPKYRLFKRLVNLYRLFDADQDVLTLEMGDLIYRGYFSNLSFSQTANSPWNWKYNITFVSLASLTDGAVRGDDSFPQNDYIVES